MSAFRILVRGTGVQPAIIAVLLARWCKGPDTIVTLDFDKEAVAGGLALLRPSVYRFHREIGLSPADLDRVGGVAATLTQAAPDIALPFEPFGLPRNGVDFHQHWLRSRALGKVSGIAAYSPSFALARLSLAIDCRQAERMPYSTGIMVDAARYSGLLADCLFNFGGERSDGGAQAAADLTIDCSEVQRVSCWKGDTIKVASSGRIPGMEAHVALEAARRWLALTAKPGESAAEEREFNRLCEAETDRIRDMEDLVHSPDPATTARPALARKIAVFSACGRVPLEDYEVFAQHEWIAALLARGFQPARHDRLADVLPEAELLSWLAELRRNLEPRGEAA